jgi:hypothetical protein
VVATAFSGGLELLDLADLEPRTPGNDEEIPDNMDRILDLDVSSDGKWLLTASVSHALALWDLETREQVSKIQPESRWPSPLRLLRGGSAVVHGTANGAIEVRELPDGRLVQTFEGVEVGLANIHLDASEERLAVTVAGVGALVLDIGPRTPQAAFDEAGAATNLRVCRGSQKVVAVAPWPDPKSVWAPPPLCPEP